jgi:hypothetical protein
LDERVQDVEHAVAAPCVRVLAQKRYLLVAVVLQGDLLAVAAEAVELVDELVDDIPRPVVLPRVSPIISPQSGSSHIWHLEVHRALGVKDVVEQVAVVVVAGKLGLEVRLEL